MADPEQIDPSIPDPDEFDPEDTDVDEQLTPRSAFSKALARNVHRTRSSSLASAPGTSSTSGGSMIVDYLRDNQPDSVRALAAALGYDEGVVSRDLKRLDVIEYDEDGRSKAPRLKHRHVAVEPIV